MSALGARVRVAISTSYPHLHAHYSTTRTEAVRTGRMTVELCCHGCGEALNLVLPWPADELDELAREVRDTFFRRHRACSRDRSYEKKCPAERADVLRLDLQHRLAS